MMDHAELENQTQSELSFRHRSVNFYFLSTYYKIANKYACPVFWIKSKLDYMKLFSFKIRMEYKILLESPDHFFPIALKANTKI